MDHFGIGAAIYGAVRIYTITSRRTGRTTSLVESLKDGDRVVFATDEEARRVARLCMDLGVKIDTVVLGDRHPSELCRERGVSQGRTLFDHSWVERWYLRAIEEAQKELDFAQQQLSGYGEAHRETRRCAKELNRWIF